MKEVKATYVDPEGNEIQVVFDDLQHELLESIDCYDKVYSAIGYDEWGNKYGACAEFSCGEFVQLTDIEFEEYYFEKNLKQLWDREKANRDFEKEFYPELAGKSEAEKQEFYRQLKR